VLQDAEKCDLEAALSFLLSILAGLATYLDVVLPFPCVLARGHTAVKAEADGELGREHVGAWWTWPGVLHPFSGRWHYFSFYDNICTPDFEKALQLVDEDLRRLCALQGEPAPTHLGTLQLLAHILHSANLGCISPPSTSTAATSVANTGDIDTAATVFAAKDNMDPARSTGPTRQQNGEWEVPFASKANAKKGESSYDSPSPSAHSVSIFEDGDWTVVEQDDAGSLHRKSH